MRAFGSENECSLLCVYYHKTRRRAQMCGNCMFVLMFTVEDASLPVNVDAGIQRCVVSFIKPRCGGCNNTPASQPCNRLLSSCQP